MDDEYDKVPEQEYNEEGHYNYDGYYECPVCGSKLYFCGQEEVNDTIAAVCVGPLAFHVMYGGSIARTTKNLVSYVETEYTLEEKETMHPAWKMVEKYG